MQALHPHVARYQQDYLDWHTRSGIYAGVPFDPRPFALLIRAQYPGRPLWAAAMERCTRAWHRTVYTHLRSPYDKERTLYGGGFWLQHPHLGTLLVDLTGQGDISGIEYHARLRYLDDPTAEPLESVLARLAPVTSALSSVH